MKTFKIYNGTLLEIGKKYNWTGHLIESDYKWFNFLCKIKKIESVDNWIEVTIYDYENKREYIFTDDGFIKIDAEFIRYQSFNLVKSIKNIFKKF